MSGVALPTGAGVGVAILVKTPGHSPVKTRLAAGIGRAKAEAFHRLAAQAVAEVVLAAQKRMPRLLPCWAVAEDAALDEAAWAGLPRMGQGQGDLGARMRHVATTLVARHGGAILLGADAPQLCVDDLADALAALDAGDHVLGPSADGGFWLFGTRGELPAAAWASTPWSHADTASCFAAALGPTALRRLRTLRDADTVDDLVPLLQALEALAEPLPAQGRLAEWLRACSVA